MALNDLLNLAEDRKKIGVSEERVRAVSPAIRQYIAFWREYPDLFVDFLQTGGDFEKEKKFKFFFYQRVFIRAAMRYQYVYMVFPRAYSKSFLSVMVLMIRCILYPGAHLFVTSGGKEQAAGIIKEKVQEICTLVPAFKREIDWSRGATQESKDYAKYIFKNGSYFDNIAARETSRGKRRHGGLIEECVGVDGKILQEVLIPTMNVSRRCADGTVQEAETLNQSQIYVTTAGYKNSFPYHKLITLLVRMVVEPEKAIILGGTYKIPVLMRLLPRTFVEDMKKEETFNEDSFEREYESIWSGTVEDAFFNGDAFDRCRKNLQPEHSYSGRSSTRSYYVIGVDVGRKGDLSECIVVKVIPQSQGPAIKSVVNMFTMQDAHFEDQAIALKNLYYKYKAKALVIDANGLGIGLIDYMVKKQETSDGDILPDFGVINDEDGEYKKYRTENTEYDAMYLIKANAPINTEAHANLQSQLNAGKIRFLIEERVAKNKLLATQRGKNMSVEERNEYLKPFVLTSILKEQMMNLREENEGVNIILKQANRSIKKDKFSALEYAMYYIKQEEESKRKKRSRRFSDFMFMS